ncbi:MAG: hypothetical protein C4B57_11960 [Deltaproteobacteria bacterium]|nr:MAG: hypothetical protein C4B57_11960 [Deltaproteobacteria bacterium]
MIDPRLFLMVDVVKGALLRRMERESKMILSDDYLSEERRCKAVALYNAVSWDFVNYIKKLHAIKSPEFLLALANSAVSIFSDNMHAAWIFAYDGKLGPNYPIHWLMAEKHEMDMRI